MPVEFLLLEYTIRTVARIRSHYVATLVMRLGPRKGKSISPADSTSQGAICTCRPILTAADFADCSFLKLALLLAHLLEGCEKKAAYLCTLDRLVHAAEP